MRNNAEIPNFFHIAAKVRKNWFSAISDKTFIYKKHYLCKNIESMKHLFTKLLLIASFLFLLTIVALGQKTSVEHSRVPVYLTAGAGVGMTDFFDAGVSPLHYHSLGLGVDMGLSVEWSRFRITADGRVIGGIAAYNRSDDNPGAYGITINPKVTFLCRVAEPAQGLRLYAGGSFDTYIDIRINQKMMNAALGLTEMMGLDGNFRLEFDIPTRRRTDLFTLYADIALPLFAVGERPEYAYVYNATSSSDPVEYLVDGYKMFFMGVPGATTDIGLLLNLKNGNRIGLSYIWNYRTTRHATTHRFDNASHIIKMYFMFNIN